MQEDICTSTRRWYSFPECKQHCVLPLQIMDKEGGERTIEELDGVQLKGSPRPLSVQPFILVSDVPLCCLLLLQSDWLTVTFKLLTLGLYMYM